MCTKDRPEEPHDEYVKIVLVSKVCLAHFLFSVGLAGYVFFYAATYIPFIANLMGVTAALLAVVQYFPQIYTTAKLKHAGSLSIPMMCMQTPGGYVWAASLAARQGTTWSSWLPYFTAASLQLIVLVLAVYYELKARSAETAPLLASRDEGDTGTFD